MLAVVVTAPLIGKVAEVSAFRAVGTIIGGMIGMLIFTIGLHAFSGYGAGVFVCSLAPFMVTGTTYLAFKKSLDQLAKFIQLTYIIVGYNAKPEKSVYKCTLLIAHGVDSIPWNLGQTDVCARLDLGIL